MKRNIVQIDSDLCNGCGLCVDACHEGALAMVDGKAKLITDSYCDGLGHCLPQCPTNAIKIIQRDADDYDEAAVLQNQAAKKQGPPAGGCPGSMARSFAPAAAPAPAPVSAAPGGESALRSWPVQLKLVPVRAPYFDGAHLLIAADCSAFAYADFHSKFLAGRIPLIGCPKLDEGDYAEKLTAILRENNIESVTILRMEVPCCGGLLTAAKTALQNCGKLIPWGYHVITIEGQLAQ